VFVVVGCPVCGVGVEPWSGLLVGLGFLAPFFVVLLGGLGLLDLGMRGIDWFLSWLMVLC
jgi:hypothetical protein